MADGWDQGMGAAASTHSAYTTCVRLQFCLVTILLFYNANTSPLFLFNTLPLFIYKCSHIVLQRFLSASIHHILTPYPQHPIPTRAPPPL